MLLLCFGIWHFFIQFCTAQCAIQLTNPWKNCILLIIKCKVIQAQKHLWSLSTVKWMYFQKRGEYVSFYPQCFCTTFYTDGLATNQDISPLLNETSFQLSVYRKWFSKSSLEVFLSAGPTLIRHHPHPFPFRFHKLEKWRKPFYDVLQVYENASVLLPAFYNTRNTDVSIRVKYVLDDFESQQAVYYFHPQYLINVSRYWLGQGVRAKRVSTGLILVTAALELCEEVHLFGFWAFPMNPSGIFITHHYYDNVKPRPGFHAMPSEIFNFLHMHSKGILRVHTGTCSCCWWGQFFLWRESVTGTWRLRLT